MVGIVAGVQPLILASGRDDPPQCPLWAVGFHSREEVLLIVGAGGSAGASLHDDSAGAGLCR